MNSQSMYQYEPDSAKTNVKGMRDFYHNISYIPE